MGTSIRLVRPAERGLLLLYPLKSEDNTLPHVGYGISFPHSERAETIEYIVPNRYEQMEIAFEEET